MTATAVDPRIYAGVLFEERARGVEDRLRRAVPYAHPDDVSEAVVEAILSHAREPEKYDPAHPLDGFLFLNAKSRLKDHFRSEQRRKVREEKNARDRVTRDGAAALHPSDEDTPDPELVRKLMDAIARTAAERAVFALWLDGVNAPAEVARRLNYGADADAVRRAKTLLDRLRQRVHREKLKRAGPPDREDEP